MRSFPARRGTLVHAFRTACERADGAALAALLHRDAAAVVDDGGITPGLSRGAKGAAAVVRLVLDSVGAPGLVAAEQPVNGQTGIVFRRDGEVVAIVCVGIRSGRVGNVWIVLGALKLQAWNR
jgi:RNA polymerase sigma-70 factor (ECF subfamily)